MPIGIGWRHPHYREMLERHPALDFLEVHSENFFAQGGARLAVLEQGRATYPISLHGMGLGLGSAVGLDDWHLDQLERLVQRIDPVRISDHACFARGGHAGQTVHAIDLLPVPFTNGALNVMCANVQRVQDRLKRPIVVENLAAYLSWKPDEADPPQAEPAFLSALARRTGCALLVDVNNLYVNALNAQASDPVKECLRWIDAIPGSCVGELHVGGHSTRSDSHGEIVMDDHASPVSEAVWRIFRHAVHSFGAVPTLVEWDTRIPAMDILLNEAQIARSSAAAILALAT
jgi:uncharacterized protein (UPF0276 family)